MIEHEFVATSGNLPPEAQDHARLAEILSGVSTPTDVSEPPWDEIRRTAGSTRLTLEFLGDVSAYDLDGFRYFSDAVTEISGLEAGSDGWVQHTDRFGDPVDSLSMSLSSRTVLNDGTDSVTATVRSQNQMWDGYIVVSGSEFSETFEPDVDTIEEITSDAPAGTVIEVQAISVGPVNSSVRTIEVESA